MEFPGQESPEGAQSTPHQPHKIPELMNLLRQLKIGKLILLLPKRRDWEISINHHPMRFVAPPRCLAFCIPMF